MPKSQNNKNARISDLLRCLNGENLKKVATSTDLEIIPYPDATGKIVLTSVVNSDLKPIFELSVHYPNSDAAIEEMQRLITAAENKYFSHV